MGKGNEGIIKMGMGNLNYICSYLIFSNLRIYLGRKAIIDIIGAEDSMCKCTPAFFTRFHINYVMCKNL